MRLIDRVIDLAIERRTDELRLIDEVAPGGACRAAVRGTLRSIFSIYEYHSGAALDVQIAAWSKPLCAGFWRHASNRASLDTAF